MSDLTPSPDAPKPHKRRVRYSGKNPRRFEEKYKEHAGDAETVAKVLAAGKTPVGTHRSIMVAEILEVLAPQPGDLVADCTLGYGGHTQELLGRITPGGRLLGLDADPLQLPRTETRLRALGFGPEMFTAHRSNFAGLAQVLGADFASLSSPKGGEGRGEEAKTAKAKKPASRADKTKSKPVAPVFGADCILADLGLSSMQIDDPARGFSVKHDGPLDMRMNPERGQPASIWLQKISPAKLAETLVANADEPHAAELAPLLAGKTFATTTALGNAIRAALPRRGKDEVDLTVRRVFQAIRIAVNDEFSALDTFLRNLPTCLKPGGRVAILTFHSGEDRRVKHAFADGLRDGLYSEISEEVIRPTQEEIRDNPRSSPAKLRWARRA